MYYLKFLIGTICFLFFVSCAHNHKPVDSKETKAIQPPPKLTKPVARRVWIEPQVLDNGSVYVDGHWKYVIQRESAWTK